MAQMSITAKIQVVASDEDKTLLDETMSVYREACNYVSDYVFRTHDLKQFSLNKALYPTLRAEFGLKSQMTQSVFKMCIRDSLYTQGLREFFAICGEDRQGRGGHTSSTVMSLTLVPVGPVMISPPQAFRA